MLRPNLPRVVVEVIGQVHTILGERPREVSSNSENIHRQRQVATNRAAPYPGFEEYCRPIEKLRRLVNRLWQRRQATVIPTHSGQTPSYSDTDTDSSDANLQALGRRWPQSVE
ncbi:hypothetical protein RRG08_061650 [Elysia crispata]|uniref:Uncharacterized protein n=2 Tax=Elysia crispata TaxID=231223 RepID=A0AAE1E1P9_9GAST|nr:hypothetical protein RRG08_061650 [Elysia crispata]